jgi:hypothetical protein
MKQFPLSHRQVSDLLEDFSVPEKPTNLLPVGEYRSLVVVAVNAAIE